MNVLVAEDDRIARRRLEAMLAKWGYEVTAVPNGTEALEVLQTEAAPQLAVLDWIMPGLDGPELCRQVRRQEREPYVYIILLTSKSLKEDVVVGMQAGADDYVVKPFDSHELRARLRSGARIIELQAELISAREALRHEATHDPLTGAWNRGAIMDALDREVARAARSQQPIGVALADLDHFKHVNDTFGHRAGDAVLVETAARMRSVLRPYDGIGRYGGEEFLIVLPHNSACSAARLAERIRVQIAGEPVLTCGGPVAVTMSVGVAAGRVGNGSDAEALVQAADEALYRAKESGRDRVEIVPMDEALPRQSGSTSAAHVEDTTER